ncbi:MAG TPA: carboxypeptidase-like regulatory domain-containing protein, partial [Niastella sp.]
MRFSAVFLLAVCLQVHATGYSQKLTLSRREASLDQVFKEIRKQTGYLFFYDLEWLQKATPVSIDVKNAPLKEVLDQLLHDQPLTYSIVDKTIVLSVKDTPKKLNISNAVFADVHGTVRNATTREPIEGVTVAIRGQVRGTRTNAKGEFTIKGVEAGFILVFSYVGFTTAEVKIADVDKELFVNLEVDSKGLENVVV